MTKSINAKYYINSMIVVACMVLFRFIPPFGSMTALGMTVFGIFLGALWGWISCDMIWPSILAVVMLGFTACFENVGAAFSAAIGSPIVQQILWLLVFSAILTVSGISQQLTNRLVKSKLCIGHPWILSGFILAASMVCAAFGANVAGILICWNFIYAISKQVGYSKEDKWPKMMIVGTIFATATGAVTMPFQAGVVATFGYLSAASNGAYASYNYFRYLILSLVIAVSAIILYFVFCRLIVKPDLQKLREQVDVGEVQPFSQQQKLAMGALVALIVLTVLPSCLPKGEVQAFLNNIGTSAIVLLLVGFMTFLRKKDGKPIFTFKELANAGIFWPMLFMVATAIVIGTALANTEIGFTATLLSAFSPLFAGKSPILFTAAVCLATLALTNVINNSVAGAIMIPVMYSFSAEIGANPLVITALVCFTSNMGLLLPCASPAGAMMHSNKEWLRTRDIIKFSLVGILSMSISAIVIGIPLGNMVLSL